MNSNHPVESPDAPKAIGPYSQAIECSPGRLLFLSGQIGINPVTGTMVTGGIEAETAQVLANLEAVLIAGGMAKWNV
ncbi:MAG TPA: Rid family hydrolase, partial [Myxococcota bacterium]|nr:Rid family hydrolase [Myxococcota bacterium]